MQERNATRSRPHAALRKYVALLTFAASTWLTSEGPIKAYAEEAGLPVHPISTFTGWQPPSSKWKDINLIVAVSFGLFVPPRLLNLATYGGLNVHPSLLPA